MRKYRTQVTAALLLVNMVVVGHAAASYTQANDAYSLEVLPPGTLGGVGQINAHFRQYAVAGGTIGGASANASGFRNRPGPVGFTDGAAESIPNSVAPTLTIESPTGPVTIPFDRSSITLSLTAVNPGGGSVLIRISINGVETQQATVSSDQSAEISVGGLLPGQNQITVTAADAISGALNGSSTLTVTREEALPSGALPATWYFAEGATHPDLGTFILVANPYSEPAPVTVELLPEAGSAPMELSFVVPALGRLTVHPNDFMPGTGVSAVVRSTGGEGVVAERAVYTLRDGGFRGGHSALGVTSPGTEWYFAEGAQGGDGGGIPFQTFILLANPSETDITANLEFHPEGTAAFMAPFTVPAGRRVTVDPSIFGQVLGRGFSTRVYTDTPSGLLAERAMWWTARGNAAGGFIEGSDSVGAASPANTWYFAEGNTGGYEEYLLLFNTGNDGGTVDLEYLPTAGSSIRRSVTIGPGQRLTLSMANELTGPGPGIRHGTTVTSLLPLVAERAMYRTDEVGNFVTAHSSTGAATTSSTWVMPEGNTYPGFETNILVANPGQVEADLFVAYLTEQPSAQPVIRSYRLPAKSSMTIAANADKDLENSAFSTILKSSVPVVAERTLYYTSTAGTLGTNSMGHPVAPETTRDAAELMIAAKAAAASTKPTQLVLPTPTPTPVPTPLVLPPAKW